MQNRRQAILKNHAMLGAPPHVVSLFWQRYNQRWKYPAQNLGELAENLVAREEFAASGKVSEAWNHVLPAAFRGHANVEQLRSGKLTVLVDCKSTAYVLSRQHASILLAALARRLGPGVVRRIDYRVRPAALKPSSNLRADLI